MAIMATASTKRVLFIYFTSIAHFAQIFIFTKKLQKETAKIVYRVYFEASFVQYPGGELR